MKSSPLLAVFFIAGLWVILLLGRGCTYQAHEYVGDNLTAYSTATFEVTAIRVNPKRTNRDYIEGCIEVKVPSRNLSCEERVRGDVAAVLYATQTDDLALAKARIGDQFIVLYNPSATKTTFQNESVRVIDTDRERHLKNASRATIVKWAFFIWPSLFLMIFIWRLQTKETLNRLGLGCAHTAHRSTNFSSLHSQKFEMACHS